MKYPMKKDEFKNLFRSYSNTEPKPETGRLLDAITEIVNDAYIEGIQEGARRSSDKI